MDALEPKILPRHLFGFCAGPDICDYCLEHGETMEKTYKRISYDSEFDLAYFSRVSAKGTKAEHSIDIGDFIIDISNRNRVIGLEVLDASKNLGMTKKQLSSVENTSIVVKYTPSSVVISLTLKIKNVEKEFRIPLVVDLMQGRAKHEKSQFAFA